jgi:CDP-6-deoxy-D-xylo-4-hexulose-3-dehydrase
MRLHKFFQKYSRYFTLGEQANNVNTPWLAFPLILKKNVPFSRLDIVTYLEQHNIQTRPVFTGNILKQPGYKTIPAKKAKGGFPNTEYIMHNAFVVGCHHGLSSKQLDYLEKTFKEFLAQFE